MRAIRKISRY